MFAHRLWIVVVALSACSAACSSDDADSSTTPGSDSGDSMSAAAGSGGGAAGTSTGATTSATTGAEAASDAMNTAGQDDEQAKEMSDGQDAADDQSGEADYSKPETWLCRPGHNDACDVNLDTTVIEADGSTHVEAFEPASDPPIDCFYVYPTVSLDETANSDFVPGMEEQSVVRAQFARLGSQCRLFAPMYRQVTLTALRALLGGMTGGMVPDRELAYADVLAAWRYYLENDNQGRGVVLIGHSQGSGVLSRLIADELDTMPLDERFLGALLIGTNVAVPEGETVGGTFEHVPLCQSADELGCVVTYASFRADAPPPEGSLFGTSSDPGMVAACTNPAALGGGSAELHAYLSKDGPGTSSDPMGPWVEGDAAIDTPFVSVPGLLSAECVSDDAGSYLAITVHGDPADPRADDITGDVVTGGEVQANWGLHLIDVHLAMGDLVDIVGAKAQALAAR